MEKKVYNLIRKRVFIWKRNRTLATIRKDIERHVGEKVTLKS